MSKDYACMLNDHGGAQVTEAKIATGENDVTVRRRTLLALMALIATAGCSGGSASVRDTGDYSYYGHSNYYRSPRGRRRGYGRW
jgi:hypothetical protein